MTPRLHRKSDMPISYTSNITSSSASSLHPQSTFPTPWTYSHTEMGSIDHEIPLIDLSPILCPSSSTSSRSNIVQAVASACQNYGFFQLTGHGISLSLQEEALRCAKRLFDLPLQEKLDISMSTSYGLSKRGYEAVGGQKLDKKPDTKEVSYFRPVPKTCTRFSTGFDA